VANSDDDRDGRNAVARGYVLASRATSIGFQMAIPALLGWWADSSWKTSPWCMLVGVVLGFILAMFEILQLAKGTDRTSSRSGQRPSDQD